MLNNCFFLVEHFLLSRVLHAAARSLVPNIIYNARLETHTPFFKSFMDHIFFVTASGDMSSFVRPFFGSAITLAFQNLYGFFGGVYMSVFIICNFY